MVNAYESSSQKIIPAVLLYAFHDDELLMIHSKKWNGLGGKLEQGESPLDAAVREFTEESGCTTDRSQWTWLGQLYFPNFKAQKNEDWWVTVFVTDLSSEQRSQVSEPNLAWVKTMEVITRDLWDGDRFFLPYVFERRPFQGTFFYQDGNCIRHEISAIHKSI